MSYIKCSNAGLGKSGGEGGQGGWSSFGTDVNWHGTASGIGSHQIVDRLEKQKSANGRKGTDGNPGHKGNEGDRLNLATRNTELNVNKILDVMEEKISSYMFLQNNTHQFQAMNLTAEFLNVLFTGSYMSKELITSYEDMMNDITENMDIIGDVLPNYQRISRDMILSDIVLELRMLDLFIL